MMVMMTFTMLVLLLLGLGLYLLGLGPGAAVTTTHFLLVCWTKSLVPCGWGLGKITQPKVALSVLSCTTCTDTALDSLRGRDSDRTWHVV